MPESSPHQSRCECSKITPLKSPSDQPVPFTYEEDADGLDIHNFSTLWPGLTFFQLNLILSHCYTLSRSRDSPSSVTILWAVGLRRVHLSVLSVIIIILFTHPSPISVPPMFHVSDLRFVSCFCSYSQFPFRSISIPEPEPRP